MIYKSEFDLKTRAKGVSNNHVQYLSHPDCIWENNQLKSRKYDDIYFSKQNGLEESRQVFLEGINFKNSLINMSTSNNQFIIGELGFGTGLNFLACWDTWKNWAPKSSRLYYYSIEAFPLSKEIVKQALLPFSEIKTLRKSLVEEWPISSSGFHRIRFDNDGIILTILQLDVLDALNSLEFQADAWFLDGFTPSKNPEMWSDSVFKELSQLIRKDGRIASFSVAAKVRNSLEKYGFNLMKKPGFMYKKHRLEGVYRGNETLRNNPFYPRAYYPEFVSRKEIIELEKHQKNIHKQSHNANISDKLDFHRKPVNGSDLLDKKQQEINFSKNNLTKHDNIQPVLLPHNLTLQKSGLEHLKIAIIGNGIAGSALAYAFQKRGIQCRLIGSYTNQCFLPAALVMPKLDLQNKPETRFFISAYLYALNCYKQIYSGKSILSKGIYKIAENEKEEHYFKAYSNRGNLPDTHCHYISKEKLQTQFGKNFLRDGLYFPKACIVKPKSVLKNIQNNPYIHLLDAEVSNVEKDHQDMFQMYDSEGKHITSSQICILASGYQSFSLIGQSVSFLTPCRGQLLLYPKKTGAQISSINNQCKKTHLTQNINQKASENGHCLKQNKGDCLIKEWPSAMVFSGGYRMHNKEDVILGTTHKEGNDSLAISKEEELEICQNFDRIFSKRMQSRDIDDLSYYTGVRAATIDRFPISGPCHHPEHFLSKFKGLKTGCQFLPSMRADVINGLYILSGLGSHGYTSAFLLAESLVSDILGEVSPLERKARYAMHPFRFLVRNLKRGL